MAIRASARCLILVAALPLAARAQPSTESIRTSPWSTEVGVGMEFFSLGRSYSGQVQALLAGGRISLADSPVGLKASGYVVRRGLSVIDNGQERTINHLVLGVAISMDMEIPVARDAALAPFAGVGLAPYARASAPSFANRQYRPSDSGTLWTAGLSLRIKNLVVQQHLIGIFGADDTIQELREYYPLTIGWRF